MPNLEIPQEDIELYLSSANLANVEKAQILNILSSYNKSESYQRIIDDIAEKTSMDVDVASDFVNAYITLIRSKHIHALTNEEILTDVKQNLTEEEEFEKTDIEIILDWLSQLLDISNKEILISTMAYGVVASNNNLFYHAKIYEELRPVFVDENLSGLALYHTLRIHYESSDKRHKDAFFVLDNSDLDDLIEILIKARSRTENIKNKFSKDLINI